MFYFAVTGSPILHSKSPEVFYAAFAGRSDLAYFRMVAASAGEAMRLFRELGLSGMNITAPFKAVENWGDASQTETVRYFRLEILCGDRVRDVYWQIRMWMEWAGLLKLRVWILPERSVW